jgi:hypothetical protein
MKYQVECYLPDFGEKVGKKPFPDQLEIEDGGAAVIYAVDDGKHDGMFVQLRSWAELDQRITGLSDPETQVSKLRAAHPEFNRFAGRRIRITVETVDEYS